MSDEILEILDDVLDNGSELPQHVSNRMLLAAIRKNYRVSANNAKCLKEEIYGTEREPGIKPRLETLERKDQQRDRFGWIVVGAAVAAVVGAIANILLH